MTGRDLLACISTSRRSPLLRPAKADPTLGRMAVLLFALWMLGIVTSHAFGGFIHLLFLLAILAIVFDLTKGRRAS
jgi:hypothetical protein